MINTLEPGVYLDGKKLEEYAENPDFCFDVLLNEILTQYRFQIANDWYVYLLVDKSSRVDLKLGDFNKAVFALTDNYDRNDDEYLYATVTIKKSVIRDCVFKGECSVTLTQLTDCELIESVISNVYTEAKNLQHYESVTFLDAEIDQCALSAHGVISTSTLTRTTIETGDKPFTIDHVTLDFCYIQGDGPMSIDNSTLKDSTAKFTEMMSLTRQQWLKVNLTGADIFMTSVWDLFTVCLDQRHGRDSISNLHFFKDVHKRWMVCSSINVFDRHKYKEELQFMVYNDEGFEDWAILYLAGMGEKEKEAVLTFIHDSVKSRNAVISAMKS
mgnify:CR=1 FL=1